MIPLLLILLILYCKNRQIKAELKPVVADDGVFWVTADEFFRYFGTLYLCAKDMSEWIGAANTAGNRSDGGGVGVGGGNGGGGGGGGGREGAGGGGGGGLVAKVVRSGPPHPPPDGPPPPTPRGGPPPPRSPPNNLPRANQQPAAQQKSLPRATPAAALPPAEPIVGVDGEVFQSPRNTPQGGARGGGVGGRGGGAPASTLELPPSGLGAATWLDRRPAAGVGGDGGNPWTQPIVTELIINDGVAYAGGGGGGGGGSSPWTQQITTEHISNEGAACGSGGDGIASGAKRASGGFNNVWSKRGDGGGGGGGGGGGSGGGWRTQGQTEPKAGMVIVRVLRATNLVAADLGGKSDPYLKLKAAGKKAKTSVVKATLNPEWNETLELRVDDLSQPISLEVRGGLMTRRAISGGVMV